MSRPFRPLNSRPKSPGEMHETQTAALEFLKDYLITTPFKIILNTHNCTLTLNEKTTRSLEIKVTNSAEDSEEERDAVTGEILVYVRAINNASAEVVEEERDTIITVNIAI